jgi:hypothetical protein
MFRTAVVFVVGLALSPHVAVAQSVDRPKEDIVAGDAWVYEEKDEITGLHIRTFTSWVTEVSAKEIVTNLINKENGGRGYAVFDHDWNRLVVGNQKFNPNDGHGVRWPLAVGKEWKHEFIIINAQAGANMKSSSLAKVVAKETVTTPAGTFETFKIDRHMKAFNVADPSRSQDTQFLMWFAPEVNHWVRRTINFTVDKRLRSSETDELIEIKKKEREAGNIGQH